LDGLKTSFVEKDMGTIEVLDDIDFLSLDYDCGLKAQEK
jgi:hypothetical protein